MLNAYQQRISDFYTARSNYDNAVTRDRALRHLDYAPVQPGQHILDVATGTGFVAIAVAEQVGERGSVVGIDITRAYLDRAQEKIDRAGLNNVAFIEIDEAEFAAKEGQFDGIYCSSAIVIFPDIAASLNRWYRWLKPGGFVAFTCHSENSFFTAEIMAACQGQGVDLPNLHLPLGNIDRIQSMLQTVGFSKVEVHPIDMGKWMDLEMAQGFWNGRTWFHQDDPLPDLSLEVLAGIKADFDRMLASRVEERGVWQENMTFYVVGRKGDAS
jgi:arsenite methyltransferase